MDTIRYPDRAVIDRSGPNDRIVQKLLDSSSEIRSCTVSWIRTPAGAGSPEGLHVHDVDQIFYLLSGTMHVQVGDEQIVAQPGALITFPAGVPHRNWNVDTPTVHLAISAPAPDPSRPFARPAQ